MMRGKIGDYIEEYSFRNKSDEPIPVYSVTNSRGFCVGYFDKDVASKDKTNYKIVPRGYLAYNPSRINVGSIGLQNVEDRVQVSPLYVVFKIKEGVHSSYLFHYLKSDIGLRYIAHYAAGSVRDTLKFSDLAKIPLRIPSMTEQARIVATIEHMDSLILLREQQLKKLDQLVKARFVELFGDPVLNPMGWEESTLSGRCEVITGNTPPRVDKENYGAHIEWIKSDNINTPSMYLTKATEYLSDIGMKKSRHVEAGSILMTCIAGSINCIGNVAVADRPVTFNQQINAIVPGEDEPLYLYVLMLLSKPLIHRRTNLMLKGILSKNKLCAIKFPFPPLSLQKEFSSFVSHIESLKSPIRASLSELQTLKKSLMQAYFA